MFQIFENVDSYPLHDDEDAENHVLQHLSTLHHEDHVLPYQADGQLGTETTYLQKACCVLPAYASHQLPHITHSK